MILKLNGRNRMVDALLRIGQVPICQCCYLIRGENE